MPKLKDWAFGLWMALSLKILFDADVFNWRYWVMSIGTILITSINPHRT